MRRCLSSQRKTPAKPPSNGTAALLKMLLEVLVRLRGIMGLRLKRQTTSEESAGRGSHGILDKGWPRMILYLDSDILMKTRNPKTKPIGGPSPLPSPGLPGEGKL